MRKTEEQVRIFKVLSAPARVRMIVLLKQRSLCVNALARTLQVTPAAVSQHLRVLRDAGVVVAEKHGYFVHYRVAPEVLRQWRKIANELFE